MTLDASATRRGRRRRRNWWNEAVADRDKRLKARGLVELGYRGLTIRSPAALRAFVDQG